MMDRVLIDRIEAMSIPEPNSGCWLWEKCVGPKGYGRIQVKGRLLRANRASWQAHNGPIPDGLWVLHKCDNPACVNPEHLYVGTHVDNVRDRGDRGRAVKWGGRRKGDANPFAKLNRDQVVQIKVLLADGLGTTEIGSKFGVARSTIKSIRDGYSWTHISSNPEDPS